MSGLDFDTALMVAEMAGCTVTDKYQKRRITPNTEVLRVYGPKTWDPTAFRQIAGGRGDPGWRAEEIVKMVQWWNEQQY
jgi:hypothetical protein